MPFLSQIQYRKVLEPSGSEAGRLADLAVLPQGDGTPTVRWAILAVPDGERIVPWAEMIAEVTHFRLRHGSAALAPVRMPEGCVRLARDLFDKEIRDRGAARSVRVSDVELEESGGHLRVTGFDVGARGLFRRAGAEGLARRFAAIVRRRLEARIVPWGNAER